jgi:tetratricopeptide (TPR) repeat protein
VEAAQHFGNAINLLQGMLAECLASVRMGTTAVSSERERALRRELSGACCSMAELYMTDLCDEDRAEEEATKFAAEAIAADESNPEGYAVGADLRLCQCRKDEAVGLLNQCAIMLRACYAAVDGEGRPKHEEEEEEDEGLDEDEEEGEEEIALEGGAAGAMEEEPQGISGAPSTLQPELPPWHARLHFAQTCMEVGELGLYGHAAETLERLIEEDDSAMEAWFLLGEAFLLGGKAEEAVDVLEEAEDILTGALMAAGVKVKAMPDAGTLASHSGAIASLAEEGREELKEKRKRMRELADAAKEKLGRE